LFASTTGVHVYYWPRKTAVELVDWIRTRI